MACDLPGLGGATLPVPVRDNPNRNFLKMEIFYTQYVDNSF